MCVIPQLVSAPLNPIPIVDAFIRVLTAIAQFSAFRYGHSTHFEMERRITS